MSLTPAKLEEATPTPSADGVGSPARARLRSLGHRLSQKLRDGVPLLVVLTLVLIAWEMWPRLTNTPTYIFPRPGKVAEAIVEEPGTLLQAVRLTATTSFVGLILAIVAGVGGAVLLGFSKTLERMLFPYAIVVQTTPTVTFAPIAVIWIGTGLWSVILVSVILCFFPMLSNSLVGLNSVDPEARSLFRLYGASRWQTMRKLRLPGAMPFIMAGARIAASLSVIGAIVGEYVIGAGGAEGGLGALIQKAAEQLRTPFLVAAALTGGCLGIVYYLGARAVSKYVLAWHPSMAADRASDARRERALIGGG